MPLVAFVAAAAAAADAVIDASERAVLRLLATRVRNSQSARTLPALLLTCLPGSPACLTACLPAGLHALLIARIG